MKESGLKEKTAKGLFWGGLSSGAQQLLNFVFGIFLARLLNADDYGMVGMLTIFTLIANTLQESGFTIALANKKDVTHQDYNAVFWFSGLLGISFYIILFFAAPLIADFYNTPQLVSLARYVFLSLLISSFSVVPHSYIFRHLMVKQKAISLTISLIVSGTTGVAMAYHGMSYWGIATQNIVYVGCVTLFYWYFAPWRPTLNVNFAPLKKIYSVSSKLLITNICTHLNNNLFSIILGRIFTEKEVGYYTQANKWNYFGYALTTDMVHNVSQPVLVQVNEQVERQQTIFRKLLRFTAFIAFPVMFGLAFIAEELIVITITDKWLPAVKILQLLCIYGAFIPIIRLYSNLVISRGKPGIYMWNTIAVCAVSLLGIVLFRTWGMHTMFMVYVTINVSWFLVWHYFIWREIKLSFYHMLKDILPFACLTIVSIVIACYATRTIENIYMLLAAKIIVTAALYYFFLRVARAKILIESIQFIRKRR